jgi:cytoskeletal protein RodZ
VHPFRTNHVRGAEFLRVLFGSAAFRAGRKVARVQSVQPQEIRLSLADLSAAGVRLRPVEAVTIVREVVLQVARGDLAGMPSLHVIRVAASGAVTIEGPVAAGGNLVARAAQLVESLLPSFDAAPEFRAPGALRLVLARALGALDLPPYTSLDEFAIALARFAAPDSVALLRELAVTWADAIGLQQQSRAAEPSDELSISDIRRARRATGLTLAEVSERSRIPVWLLRQLEWGYLVNWPGGHYGRTQLVRYARAAGLDPELVVKTAWPLLREADRVRQALAQSTKSDPVDSVAPATVQSDAEVDVAPETVKTLPVPPARRRRPRWAAALAIPALLAIGVLIPRVWREAPATSTDTTLSESAAPEISQPVTLEASAANAAPTSGVAREAQLPAAPARAAADTPRERQEGVDATPRAVSGGFDVVAAQPVDLETDDRAFSPAFATEGSAMFYHADADGGSALMRADTDSRGAILRVTSIVNDRAQNFHVRPSPDGERIAFDSDRDGVRAVYIADADGRNVKRVSGDGFAAVPSWSPDGRMLAFVRAEPGRPRVWNLWTADLGTGEMHRLTSHKVGQPWGGSWFPDGERIAYSHENRLVVLDLSDGRKRVYSAPRQGLLRTPAVSPDGRRVIFQIHRDGAWLLDLKDGSMRKVLSDPTAEEFTWAPDGRRVAFHSRRSGTWGVWVMTSQK